jgi:3-oxoacyl-[acyl-carrier protein] reductase
MSDKTVLVTGASSAIGCEIIREIAHQSTVVLAHYNSNLERLSSLQGEVPAQIIPIQADLATQEGVASLVESVAGSCEFPEQIVLLAAPSLSLIRFKDLRLDDFKRQFEVQLYAAFSLLSRFLPRMAAAKRGKVVFVLSSYTLGTPPAALAHYVSAKYALLGLMKSLAAEYAGKGVCINAVSPSMVETGFLSNIPGKLVEMTSQQHPLKRNAVPSDIAPAVRFLLCEEAGYLTGVNLPITGGL